MDNIPGGVGIRLITLVARSRRGSDMPTPYRDPNPFPVYARAPTPSRLVLGFLPSADTRTDLRTLRKRGG
jgi:hypothetical protein